MGNLFICSRANAPDSSGSMAAQVRGVFAALSVALTLAVCVTPTEADAAVSISDKVITVDTGTMMAVINRNPINIKFIDQQGRVILQQENTDLVGEPFLSIDPQPLNTNIMPTPSKYAPFQYEVGWQKRRQWLMSYWVGNLAASARGGFMHAARAVKSAKEIDGGVRLELSTTEWDRTLIVNVYPDPLEPSSIRVNAEPFPRDDVISIGDSFRSSEDEQFYGFGGQHNALSQRGNRFHSWAAAQNYGAGYFTDLLELLPFIGNAYQFPGGPHATYYSSSLFISSKGYGVSVNEDNLVRWRMAHDAADKWQFTATTRTLDYTVSTGQPAIVSSKITKINGRHKLPPLWSQGATITRTYSTGQSAEVYKEKVLDDIREIETRNAPVTAYVMEWSFILPVPFVQEIIQRLKARDIRTVLYLRAFADNGEPNTLFDPVGSNEYYDAIEKGLTVKTKDGKPYVHLSVYNRDSAQFDFTNPATVDWWKIRVHKILDLGAEGFMLDFGEQILDGMHFHNGKTGWDMHQRNPILYTQITRKIVDDYLAANPGRDIFIYNRAGSSGRPGSAAYEMSNFAGDGNTDWTQSSGLPSQTIDMLSRALGGAYGFNTDIGGYTDIGLISPPATAELFTRWAQWAALTPFMRVHNSTSTGVRMPWAFDENIYAAWVDSVSLHNRLLPLIRAEWANALNDGIPPLQPLWMAFPSEPGAAAESQAWMIGKNFLAAPVVKEGALTKTVYLPSGCWKYGPSGNQYTGGVRVTVAAPLNVIPYFTRCGTNPV